MYGRSNSHICRQKTQKQKKMFWLQDYRGDAQNHRGFPRRRRTALLQILLRPVLLREATNGTEAQRIQVRRELSSENKCLLPQFISHSVNRGFSDSRRYTSQFTTLCSLTTNRSGDWGGFNELSRCFLSELARLQSQRGRRGGLVSRRRGGRRSRFVIHLQWATEHWNRLRREQEADVERNGKPMPLAPAQKFGRHIPTHLKFLPKVTIRGS